MICSLCLERKTAFRAPYDEIGVVLMECHIRDKHPGTL